MDTLEKPSTDSLREPHERLKWARAKHYKSAAAAAKAMGIPDSTYRAYEAGSRGFDNDDAKRFGRRFRVDALWLLTLSDDPRFREDLPLTTPNSFIRSLPVLSSVEAGLMTNIADPYEVGGGEDEVTVPDAADLGANAFALFVEGESMIAKPGSGEVPYMPGDTVICDPSASLRPGCIVVAKTTDHEKATLKKYRPRGYDHNNVEIIDLVPLNEDWPTLRIDASNPGIIVGKVVRHIRRDP